MSTVSNGRLGPTNDTSQMAYGFRYLVDFASAGVSLGPVTVICTGTPGAVVVETGDVVSAHAEGLVEVAFTAGTRPERGI